MNCFVGGEPPENLTGVAPGIWKVYSKMGQIINPSNVMGILDEREDSINDGWFAVNMDGYEPSKPAAYTIVDFPASYHNGAGGFAFADGHSEIRKWVDPRTRPVLKPGQLLSLGQASPNNLDVGWLQERTSVPLAK